MVSTSRGFRMAFSIPARWFASSSIFRMVAQSYAASSSFDWPNSGRSSFVIFHFSDMTNCRLQQLQRTDFPPCPCPSQSAPLSSYPSALSAVMVSLQGCPEFPMGPGMRDRNLRRPRHRIDERCEVGVSGGFDQDTVSRLFFGRFRGQG